MPATIEWIEGWETIGSEAAIADRYTVVETGLAASLEEEGAFAPVALKKLGGGHTTLTPLAFGDGDFGNAEERIVGFRFRATRLGTGAESTEIQFLDGATIQCFLEIVVLETGGVTDGLSFFLRRGVIGNLIDSVADWSYQGNTWIYVELKLKTHNTVGSYELRINGNNIMSGTGVDTSDTGLNQHSAFNFKLATSGGGTSTAFLDDIYIKNTTLDSDFLGKLSTGTIVEAAILTNDGDILEFIPDSGTLHFDRVDDPLQKDDDTTYLRSALNDKRDLFVLSDIGIISGNIISIMLEAQLRIEAVGSRIIHPAIRDDQDNDYNPSTEGIAVIDSTSYKLHQISIETNPANGESFTLATANASQLGLYVSSGTGTAVRCTRFTCQILGLPLDPGTVTPSALPAVIPTFMFNDWTEEVQLGTAWLTDISKSAVSSSEERRSLIKRPYRSMRTSIFGIKQSQLHTLRMNLARSATSRGVFPLYCDASELLADQADGSDILTLTAATHRFFIGGRIVLVERDLDGFAQRVEYAQIAEVSTGQLKLTAGITPGFPTRSVCFPLFESEIKKRHSVSLITTEVGKAQLEVLEVAEKTALPATRSGFPQAPVYAGYPIFIFDLQWSATMQSEVSHDGEQFPQGKGIATYLAGDRPRFLHKVFIEELERADFWPVLEFFDSRRGRTHPFWIFAPDNLFEVLAVSANNITVAGTGNIEDLQDFLPYIGILLEDETIIIRGVTDVQDDAGDFRILFDQTIDASIVISDIEICTPAHFVRSNLDEFEEHWKTTEVVNVRFEALDLPEEKGVSVKEPDAEIVFSDPGDIEDLWAWFDANQTLHVWTGANEGDRTSQPATGDEGVDSGVIPPAGELISVVDDFRITPSARFLVPRRFTSAKSANWWPRFHDPTSPSTNNGLFTFAHATVSPVTDDSAGFIIIDENGGDLAFWNNTNGLTIAIHMAPSSATKTFGHVDYMIYRKDIIEWWDEGVKLWETKGVDDTDLWIPHPSINEQGHKYSTWIFVWQPSTRAIVYEDGIKRSTDPTRVADTIDLASPDDLEIGGAGLGVGIQGNGALWTGAQNHATQSRSNSMLVYDRALTVNELNFLGQWISDRYGTSWTTIV